MKPMVPTFDEARELALTLCNEGGMTAMQRSAAAGILNYLERSAGPDLKAGKRLIITLEARLAEYEKAIEEKFKPALKAAIVAVLVETIDDFHADGIPGGATMTEQEA